MRRALELAVQAKSKGEIPVGAVVVLDGEIIGEGWNQSILLNDPTAHAEIVALRAAGAKARNYRLEHASLYVTLEPCAMCAGAMVLARIQRLVYSTRDLRFGAVRSKFRLADSELLNHRMQIEEGLLAAEAAEILSEFFRQRRSEQRF